jgi:sulfite exporter TauE/SafE
MDYWTAFVLGLVGSLHCAGMCGPLVLALPQTGISWGAFVLGRIAYNWGRLATYCLLGIVFGCLGQGLVLSGFQRSVSITLGAVLLLSLFAPKKLALSRPITGFVSRLKSPISTLLRRPSFASVATLGLLNGLLPCGLVYVAGAGATATGHIVTAVAYMAAFGAGTIPMLLVISISGNLASFGFRIRLRKLIPISVCLLGSLLILRGLSLGIPYLSPDLSTGANCCRR